jgi:hypothetical protein
VYQTPLEAGPLEAVKETDELSVGIHVERGIFCWVDIVRRISFWGDETQIGMSGGNKQFTVNDEHRTFEELFMFSRTYH